MNYSQTLDWMYFRLPMYQRQGGPALKKDLTNSIAFSKHLGKPESQYPSVHVAGTNGKGSTSHMVASVLQEAGYNVGLYTSPHLKDFRERVRVNGQMISEEEVVNFVKANKNFLEQHSLSFFELTVGMAFDHFARKKVDIAVVEVGLGGRLDSTNILRPLVSVITNIGLDHTQFLGETLPEIAFEKGGIIKPGVPVVIGEAQEETLPVFEKLAADRQAPLVVADQEHNSRFETDLVGSYQKKNLQTTLKTIELLQKERFEISETHIRDGLLHVIDNTGLKGRYQVLRENPKVICDTAHNREGLELVLDQVMKEGAKALHFVLGFVNDKDLDTVLPLFPGDANYYFCRPDIPRGLDSEVLLQNAEKYGLKGQCFEGV
ncbi:MAG: folylpolyglutamate synthase/dihydrofolate synthase family protein, partial [Lutimonas sp.]